MPSLIGNNPTQVPTNGDLGTLAFQDSNAVNITGGSVATTSTTLGSASANPLTINSSAVTTPNGLNFDSNTFVIDATNNRVGIGTPTPSSQLFVLGLGATVRVQTTDNATFPAFQFMGSGGGQNASISTISGVGGLTFAGSGGELMRLDNSGNLGLGVTPSAWGASRFAIDMGSNAYVGGTALSHLTNNVFFNGTNFIYKTTATSGMYQIAGNAHQWYTAPSGTAGNAITFTQAMTLDASGRLLVGATSTAAGNTKTIELSNAGTSTNQPAYRVVSYPGTTAAANGYFEFYRSRGAAVGTNTIVASGDRLGMVRFSGANGTDYSPAAEIYSEVDGTPGATNDMPGRLIFATTADGAGTTTERMRITSGGNVGINLTPAANHTLSVRGANTANTDFTLLTSNSGTTTTLGVRNDGAITTGTASQSPYNLTTGSAANVHVASDGYLYRSTSSLKYKTNVEDATHGLAEVLQLRPVTYKGTNDGDIVFGGLIAEEVDAIGLTEFVQYAEDGSPDALAYGNMVSLLAKAIQEQQAMIETLKAEVALLKSK